MTEESIQIARAVVESLTVDRSRSRSGARSLSRYYDAFRGPGAGHQYVLPETDEVPVGSTTPVALDGTPVGTDTEPPDTRCGDGVGPGAVSPPSPNGIQSWEREVRWLTERTAGKVVRWEDVVGAVCRSVCSGKKVPKAVRRIVTGA